MSCGGFISTLAGITAVPVATRDLNMDTVFDFILRLLRRPPRRALPTSVFHGMSKYDIQVAGEDLCALLDEHPAARHVMADLSHLERTLRLQGPQAVDRLPPDRLRWALSQLRLLGPRGCEGPVGFIAAGLAAATRPHVQTARTRRS